MKSLLFVSHTPSDNTTALASLAKTAICEYAPSLQLIAKQPHQVQIQDGLACDGIIIGTLENIGYMSGMTKDMFDRCYNGWLDKQAGLPALIYIRAGHDGTATNHAITAISTGLKWRLIQPPIMLSGRYSDAFGTLLSEQVAGFALGLEQGIY